MNSINLRFLLSPLFVITGLRFGVIVLTLFLLPLHHRAFHIYIAACLFYYPFLG